MGWLDRWRARAKPAPDTPDPMGEPTANSADATLLLVRECVAYMRHDYRSERRMRKIRHVLVAIALISGIVFTWQRIWLSGALDLQCAFSSDAACQPLAIVTLQGSLQDGSPSTADAIIASLERASRRTKDIVLYIDSPGGSGVQAQRIGDKLVQLRNQGVRVTVVAGSTLASAAYLVATHADRIVVPKYALVGSVGAVQQGWDISGLLEKLDIKPRTIASGPLKAAMSPFEPQDEASRRYTQQLIEAVGRQFVADVQRLRGSRLKLEREQIASGAVWDGAAAVAAGLADENGTLESVLAASGRRAQNFGGSVQRSGLLSVLFSD